MANQKDKWRATRQARMDELFKDRQYRLVESKSFDEPKETPLGYTVKHGYVVESVDGEQKFVVGKSLLNILANEYHAIDLPPAKRRGRPKHDTLDLASEWASRDVPDDASPVTQPGPTYTNPNEDEKF